MDVSPRPNPQPEEDKSVLTTENSQNFDFPQTFLKIFIESYLPFT